VYNNNYNVFYLCRKAEGLIFATQDQEVATRDYRKYKLQEDIITLGIG